MTSGAASGLTLPGFAWVQCVHTGTWTNGLGALIKLGFKKRGVSALTVAAHGGVVRVAQAQFFQQLPLKMSERPLSPGASSRHDVSVQVRYLRIAERHKSYNPCRWVRPRK